MRILHTMLRVGDLKRSLASVAFLLLSIPGCQSRILALFSATCYSTA